MTIFTLTVGNFGSQTLGYFVPLGMFSWSEKPGLIIFTIFTAAFPCPQFLIPQGSAPGNPVPVFQQWQGSIEVTSSVISRVNRARVLCSLYHLTLLEETTVNCLCRANMRGLIELQWG